MLKANFQFLFLIFFNLICGSVFGQYDTHPVSTNLRYGIFTDHVEQKPYSAKALSDTEIISDYQSAANLFLSPQVTFKFSINGKDNEMLSGIDHHFSCIEEAGFCETPLIQFGKQLNDKRPIPLGVYLKPETRWRIRLDMREVFKQFDLNGYYETFNKAKIFKADFKGVYVAGSLAPLTWDFDNLHNFKHLELKDPDGDHIYELDLVLNSHADKKITNPTWKLSLDTKQFPQYKSEYVLTDALYNLALEEMIRAVEKDSTLRTGKEWAGVWTRDVSYSIILAMATLQTKVSQYSLMKKVKDGMIIQDTGTGGAYPISTDRMIWAVAAWEIYKVTGDMQWLRQIYPIVKKSLEADLKNIIDRKTGLVKGESSFLDWREQSYPEWMQPTDIFESQCLGTNAAHYQAHQVLSHMAEILKEDKTAAKHKIIAENIKKAINENLWLNEKGYYGQFLYGRNYKIVSPKSEALGEALCVLFDIANSERQKQIVQQVPVNEFGIPCIYPQIPNIPPYHNDAVWPFVQSYWTLACAKAANENAVLESIGAIYRPAALFLTNKENFVASTGDYAATQINSDNMLWSLSGNISMIYKVLFGMNYEVDKLTFRPFVPEKLKGSRNLTNFRYRNATLNIEMQGHGNVIKTFLLDGKQLSVPEVPGSLVGNHSIKIVLANNSNPGRLNKVPNYTAPEIPDVKIELETLTWSKIQNAIHYLVLQDGNVVAKEVNNSFRINDKGFAEYQVIAIDSNGVESFASEPVTFIPKPSISIIELENHIEKSSAVYQGFSGTGFIKTDLDKNTSFTFPITIPEDGLYLIDFRYSNGNGPVNTENKCGIRTLHQNDNVLGSVVFPQRGKDEWSDWGFSNGILCNLKKGENSLTLAYMAHNENMNGSVNGAAIDYVRIIQID